MSERERLLEEIYDKGYANPTALASALQDANDEIKRLTLQLDDALEQLAALPRGGLSTVQHSNLTALQCLLEGSVVTAVEELCPHGWTGKCVHCDGDGEEISVERQKLERDFRLGKIDSIPPVSEGQKQKGRWHCRLDEQQCTEEHCDTPTCVFTHWCTWPEVPCNHPTHGGTAA